MARGSLLDRADIDEAFITVVPDWLCEVLSPGTRRTDRMKKMPIDAREEVARVWLADPAERTVEVLRFSTAQFTLVGPSGATVPSVVLEALLVGLRALALARDDLGVRALALRGVGGSLRGAQLHRALVGVLRRAILLAVGSDTERSQLRGKRWPTSEHFFQAQKFENERDREDVRKAGTPMLAARVGRDRRRKLRRDWETVKIAIMREALEAKFRQHTDLGALLLSTGDALLIEHTENDDYWGDGGDGSGRNELGRLLMATRDALRSRR